MTAKKTETEENPALPGIPEASKPSEIAQRSDESREAYEKRLRKEFVLHVALIQREKSCSTGEAKFLAWLEGMEALSARLKRD